VLREAAALALGDIGGETARRLLQPALADPDDAVRDAAAEALGQREEEEEEEEEEEGAGAERRCTPAAACPVARARVVFRGGNAHP
jgi:HEAT repeat protein